MFYNLSYEHCTAFFSQSQLRSKEKQDSPDVARVGLEAKGLGVVRNSGEASLGALEFSVVLYL